MQEIEAADRGLLTSPAWGPPRLPQGVRFDGYLGDSAERLTLADGRRVVADSSLPIVTRSASGRVTPVDLSLVADAQGWAPANAVDPVQIPRQLASGVLLTRSGITVVPVDAEGAPLSGDPAVESGAAVTFPNTQTDTDTVIKPIGAGVETAAVLRSAASPQTLYYSLELPSGDLLGASSSLLGGYDVYDLAGKPVAAVLPPTATDAAGNAVPVTMTQAGDTLVVMVSAGADVEYPVTVDPDVANFEGSTDWWQFTQNSGSTFGYGLGSGYLQTYVNSGDQFSTGELGAWYYATQGESQIWALTVTTAQSNSGNHAIADLGSIFNPSNGWPTTQGTGTDTASTWLPTGSLGNPWTWTSPTATTVCTDVNQSDQCLAGNDSNANVAAVEYVPQGTGNALASEITGATVYLSQSAPPQAAVAARGRLVGL